MNEFHKYCSELSSKKVRERKKSSEMLPSLLDEEDIVAKLNDPNNTMTWPEVFLAVNEFVAQEAERKQQDVLKKNITADVKTTKKNDLLLKVVKVANRGEIRISVSRLMQAVVQGLNYGPVRTYFSNTYLAVLKDHILLQERTAGQLESQDWIDCLELLADIYAEDVHNISVLTCLLLFIKQASLHRCPVLVLRKQFHIFYAMCETLDSLTPRAEYELILQLLTEFCKINMNDCHKFCCKLGEDVFDKIYSVYLTNMSTQIKIYFFEFLLLQMQMHHPFGARHPDPVVCAYSWEKWLRILAGVHGIVKNELLENRKKIELMNVSSSAESGRFCSAFFDLIVEVCNQMNNNCVVDDDGSHKNKRLKTATVISGILDEIEANWELLSIEILTRLLAKYPDLITCEEFTRSLKIMSTYQPEMKDMTSTNAVYDCFAVLADVDANFKNADSNFEHLWLQIFQSIFKFMAWNSNNSKSHVIIQKLLLKHEFFDYFAQIRPYFANNLVLTKSNLETLNVACMRNNLSQQLDFLPLENESNSLRKYLLRFIINNGGIELLAETGTCQLLVSLICNVWPKRSVILHDYHLSSAADDDDTIRAMQTRVLGSLNKTLIAKLDRPEVVQESWSVQEDLLEELKSLVATKSAEVTRSCFNKITFLAKMLSGFLHVNVVSEESFEDSFLTALLAESFGFIGEISQIEFQRIFNLQLHPLVCTKLRDLFDVNYIKMLFEILYKDSTKREAFKTLSLYCACYRGQMTENQVNTVSAISQLEFNYASDEDYNLFLMFASFCKHCALNSVPAFVLSDISTLLQSFCNVRYFEHQVALSVLQTLKDVFKLVLVTNQSALIETYWKILLQFHEIRSSYGPKVSRAILDCFEQILQFEVREERIGSMVIVEQVRTFILSPFIEVRLEAARVLVSVFNSLDFDGQERLLNDVHLQIKNGSLLDYCKVPEEVMDEQVKNGASLLHFYAALINVSSLWRAETLYFVFEIVSEKSMDFNDFRAFLNITAQEAGHKNGADLIDHHVERLVEAWYTNNRVFNNFPFALLNCRDLDDFLRKYFRIVFHVAVQTDDHDLLADVCRKNDINNESLPEGFYASLASTRFLFQTTSTLFAEAILDKNTLFCHVVDVILGVLKRIYDEDFFCEQFDFRLKLSPIYTDHTAPFTEFRKVLCKLQDVLGVDSLVSMLFESDPYKLHEILLKLQAEIHESAAEQQQIAFFRYTIFADYLIEHLSAAHSLNMCLKRSILCALMHLIKRDSEHYNPLNIMACKYLKRNYSLLLTDFNDVLVTNVNDLILICHSDNELSCHAMEVLSLLITNNEGRFEDVMKLLDPFPNERKFARLTQVYDRIKYKNGACTLREEIGYFIQAGKLAKNTNSREEGLRHLRKLLSEHKEELNELYVELSEAKHSLIYSETSVVHQLICMLVQLARSRNKNICVEATRCLGELGPRDITTMVFQIEKNCLDLKCSPQVFVTGQILALLSDYVVDENVNVIKISCRLLCEILLYKEGKIVTESRLDYGRGVVEKSYLLPFISKSRNLKAMKVVNSANQFEEFLDKADLWCPDSCCTHADWITNLVTNVLQVFDHPNCYLTLLIDLCKIKIEFCEAVLPLLVYLILVRSDPLCCDIIAKHVQNFFTKHIANLGENADLIVGNKASLKCMLDVVNFVRIQKIVANSCGSLTLDYLKVAKAAQYCASYCTSIYYAELWCQEKLKRKDFSDKELSLTPLELVCLHEPEETKSMLQDVFKEAYAQLGDNDAAKGCKITDLYSPEEQLSSYKEQNQWQQVIFHYDMQNKLTSSEAQSALKQCAIYELPLKFDIEFDSQYECAWRLSRWHLSDMSKPKSFEKSRYFALKALQEQHRANFADAIASARDDVIGMLKVTHLESSKNLYEILTNLQALQEVEDFERALTSAHDSCELVFCKWRHQSLVDVTDFSYIEPVMTQRVVMLKNQLASRPEFNADFYQFAIELIRTARTEKRYNIAERTIATLSSVVEMSSLTRKQVLFEKAQVTWFSDKDMGKSMLRHLFTICRDDNKLYSSALRLYGSWLIETCAANAKKIITDYFLESLSCAETEAPSSYCGTYDELARFCDQQYQRYETYTNSNEFKRKVKTMERSRLTAAKIHKKSNSTADEKRAMVTHEKQSKLDETEIQNTFSEKNMYLTNASKYYLLNLRHDEKSYIRIFRVISLWLQNKANTDLEEILEEAFNDLPTYKFVQIIPQLVPHISNVNNDFFSGTIFKIIERCAKDHPYHVLPMVLAIANSNKDAEYCSGKVKVELKEARILGGQLLLKKLKAVGRLRGIIEEMELVHDALIELAYVNHEKYKTEGSEHEIPKKCKMAKIKGFSNVLLPTLTVAIRKDCSYNDIIGIHSFYQKFTSVGGINAPKRVTCVGTDGKSRSQLVKGQDDLRQDAVMQQVFTIMNELLASNKQTKNLRIRTYKIVPLSRRSGILEWVQNSIPIADYLTGKNGAHETYNPQDMPVSKCREMIRNSSKSSNERKLQTYLNICQRFHPVFHKFFEMSFPQTTVWYERRRAYLHSVATSSMCGYILGIGDRHLKNVLIDKISAEVIHIDFGIAFEQGLNLPTPETVPFRLSRDIEAGMGILGTQGTFKKACEETMTALRENSETIISILEVLLYDPLYTWTITPVQAYNRQFRDSEASGSSLDSDSDETATAVNSVAERALFRLRAKLNGIENNSRTTVESQVERLLQEARDPVNLSKLFSGWQAFL